MIFDKLVTSAGVISVCAIPIDLVALIPFTAAIGFGVYVNKKDEETFNEMCEVNLKYNELQKEIAYSKLLKKN